MADDNTTNDNLISEILKSLRDHPDADQALVEILAEHIVKIDTANTAVDDAADVIEKLALAACPRNTSPQRTSSYLH